MNTCGDLFGYVPVIRFLYPLILHFPSSRTQPNANAASALFPHLYALFSKPAFVTAALQNLYYHTSVRLYRHIFRLCNIFRFLTPHFKLQFSLCFISPHRLSLLYKLHTIIFLFMLFYTSEKCYFFILMLDYTLFS